MSLSLTSDASNQWKSAYMNEAWRLLTVLLSQGHPVTSSDLAVGCTSEVVEFLCRIPGSPLTLTNDGLIKVSPWAMLALVEFVLRLPAVADFGVDGSVNLSRKRKRPVITLNANKRRSVLLSDGIGSGNCSFSYLGHRIQDTAAERIHACKRTSGFNFLNDKCLQHGLNFFSQYMAMISLPPSHGGIHSNDTWSAIVKMYSERITHLANTCYLVHNGTKENGILLQKMETDAIFLSKPDVSLQIMEGTESAPVALKLLEDKKNTQATPQIMVANVADVIKICLEEEGENSEAKTFDDASARFENHHSTMQIKLDAEHAELCTNNFWEPGEHAIDAARATIDANLSDKPVICDSGQVCFGPHIFSRTGIEASVKQLDLKQNIGAKGVAKQSRKKIIRHNQNVLQNKTAGSVSLSEKDTPETQKLPVFDSFVVVEEEGSGGYGTVYRAWRKTDEKTFAIKCPHANAHSYHVNNELKMLKQFGGKSFIIKFEGSFRNDNSECFVLEHVKHDRPEVLKKEIDVSELQWYGFCMFKALASLHKHGIVHRDVKPGNFLFCRELCKGYLIDFNLALDLNHKYRPNNISDSNTKGRLLQSLACSKLVPPMQSRKALNCKLMEPVSKHVNKESHKLLLPKKSRRKTEGKSGNGLLDFESRNPCENQAADTSALTSAKDATSNRTPSVDRLREPVPSHGRRELINLVQEVMRSPNQKTSPAPISQRKRIAAPVGKVERTSTLVSPMPLYSNGITVSTAGMLKNKGDGKHKNEGACVGTRGFRAPEVLFKSLYQGCKIDVWSAGVTLLYLMIGRTPFGCEAEQNIKEIAKLRGSEALWEVAKLHNRELSFPTELLDVQSLQFMELKNWCQKNTKRPEFLERIPDTLFDLVDKCLMVNPRLRISAEECLMHDFFSPCRESLRKQRLLRISRDSQRATQLEERR